MLQKFINYFQRLRLFNPETDKILLAVSGGMDSVALADLFYRAGYLFGIAHCNFQLRGEESEMDAHFVEQMASRMNCECYVERFNTDEYAKQHGVSVQMAARELRYKWFDQLLSEKGYHYLATAHHLDDQIETFFINLLRGTGIAGLHGILPMQNNVIRPLMFSNRKEIENYINDNQLNFRIDKSNLSLKYQRNKIRLQLIPVLAEINPDYQRAMNETIERIKNSEIIYRKEIDAIKKKIIKTGKDNAIKLSIPSLKKLSPLNAWLFEFLSPYGFNYQVVKDIIRSFDAISGKTFYSKTHRLVKDRDVLIIIPDEKNNLNATYMVQRGVTSLSEPFMLYMEIISDPGNYKIEASASVACLDYDKLTFPLMLRRWREGDAFHPLGMSGRKKISDFFIDNKISLPEKKGAWLLISGNDIVWLIGHRIDERFKITFNTKNIYRLEIR
ncbi:MAG: tRNA lysidine(34) synthetase TilS [Bacteroidales bacterium]|nr:tRNA lysidine(34) synthetase TilS [Bacteroidales bacterium]